MAAVFEEISIVDLEKELSASQPDDVRTVYEDFWPAPRKHLRSYVSDLEGQGIEYQPRYLEAEEFQEIDRQELKRAGWVGEPWESNAQNQVDPGKAPDGAIDP